MFGRRILFSFITLLICAGILFNLVPSCRPVQAADSYAIVVPSVLQTGSTQAVSVALLRGDIPVTGKVRLSLLQNNREVFVYKGTVQGKDRLVFNLPDLEEGEYIVKVQGDTFSDQTTVRVENRYLVLVETDKPVYKPGQTIHIRLISLSPDLLPLEEEINVEVLDAKGIKIFKSRVRTDDYGMGTVDLHLSSEPNLGVWKITASNSKSKSQVDVRVEKYVLPKYEVKAETTREWFLVNEAIKGTVSAEYSFGKLVSGDLEIQAWRYVGQWEKYYTFSTFINGEVDFTIPPVGYVAGVPAAGGNGNVRVDIAVVEKSTGYREETSKLLTVTSSDVNLQVIPASVTFKPGLPFRFLIISQTPDNQLVDKEVQVHLTCIGEDFKNLSKETRKIVTVKGKAFVEIVPPDESIAMIIECSTENAYATKTLAAGYSPSGNFIHLEQLSEGAVTVGGEVSFRIYSTTPASGFYYEIISKNRVVYSDYTRNNEITVPVTPQMAPSSRLLVYQILPNSEIAADYLPFDVTADYPLDVSINVTPDDIQPGDDVTIQINTAEPSKVGIAAVDKSVFILAENRMNLQQVFAKLEELYMQPRVELHEVSIYNGISTRGAGDVFNDAGVVVLSNKKVPEGKDFRQAMLGRGDVFFGALEKAAVNALPPTLAVVPAPQVPASAEAQGLAEVQRIRQYFPETWLWQDLFTDNHGKATINTQAPDSITTWILRAVAISKTKGLGISEGQVRVFQPFFLSIDLPYEVIRGEEFSVKVAVYNYLNTAQDLQVEMQTGDWFDLMDSNIKTVHIPASDIGSCKFTIRPKSLGSHEVHISARSKQAADAAVKSLNVVPEGVGREIVDNVIVRDGTSVFSTVLPGNIVEGSGRVYLTVTGGYLTQTIEGLEKLIQMPFGCGEQNMIVFAPDVFITRYLKESGQLKPEIMAKAELLMITGYQRELTYRHNDGSFSAFGESDKSGSLWLTAFVLKSFDRAKELIYIDEEVLEKAKQWIISHQNKDGSFDQVGFVHHQEMMGGLKGKTALTAYVALALLEAGEKTASAKAVDYLEKSLESIDDPYTMALVAYSLELAQSFSKDAAYRKLIGMVKEDENGMYWEGTSTDIVPTEIKVRNMVRSTASIETTAYALMALVLHGDNISANKTAQWLLGQRNALGGYGSTQDTVVALDALTKYALNSGTDINLQVKVKFNGGSIKELKIDNTNYDVLHVIEVPVNQEITIEAAGTGEAIAQIVRRFNMPLAEKTAEDIMRLNVHYSTSQVEVNDIVQVFVEVYFNPPVPVEAGMTVLDIAVPTGFTPVSESIDKVIQQLPCLKRYDIAGRKVIFYIENLLPGDRLEFSFDIQALYPVKAKGVYSSAYSYYNPEINAGVLGTDLTVQ